MTAEPRDFRITIPAEARHLKAVRAFLEPILAESMGDQLPMVVLGIDEACSNVIRHRPLELGHGAIDLRLTVYPDGFRLRIGTFCRTTDLPRIQPRDLKDVRPGGLGTHFIGSIMDKIAYEPEPDQSGCMSLVLEKRRPAVP